MRLYIVIITGFILAGQLCGQQDIKPGIIASEIEEPKRSVFVSQVLSDSTFVGLIYGTAVRCTLKTKNFSKPISIRIDQIDNNCNIFCCRDCSKSKINHEKNKRN